EASPRRAEEKQGIAGMRARTVFIVLLICIALIAFGPALIAVVSQTIAEGFGCQVDLNRAIPCVIGGKDYGQTFYNLGFSIWYSYLSLPAGLALFGAWALAVVVAVIVHFARRKSMPGADTPNAKAKTPHHAEGPPH